MDFSDWQLWIVLLPVLLGSGGLIWVLISNVIDILLDIDRLTKEIGKSLSDKKVTTTEKDLIMKEVEQLNKDLRKAKDNTNRLIKFFLDRRGQKLE